MAVFPLAPIDLLPLLLLESSLSSFDFFALMPLVGVAEIGAQRGCQGGQQKQDGKFAHALVWRCPAILRR